MILDIIVVALMVIPAALGIYRGFLNMFVRMTGWIIAVAAGYFFKDTASNLIAESPFGYTIRQHVAERFAASYETVIMSVDSLPEIIKGGITTSSESASEVLAGMFSSFLISLVAFVGIVVLVWFLLKILVRPANKRKKGGIISTSNKMVGFIFGFLEGVILVFVFMTVLLGVVNFAPAETSAEIMTNLQESMIARTLYDNNLLLLITGGILGQ